MLKILALTANLSHIPRVQKPGLRPTALAFLYLRPGQKPAQARSPARLLASGRSRHITILDSPVLNSYKRTAFAKYSAYEHVWFPSILSPNTTALTCRLILFMNANDIGEGEGRTGERNKRKMTASNQEPPSNPRKRIKAGYIGIFCWACSNFSFYRRIFQDRPYPRPVWRPRQGRRAVPVP